MNFITVSFSTAPAEECQASAVHRGAAVTDLDRTCRCQRSVGLELG